MMIPFLRLRPLLAFSASLHRHTAASCGVSASRKQKTRWASAKRVLCAPPDIFGLERTSL